MVNIGDTDMGVSSTNTSTNLQALASSSRQAGASSSSLQAGASSSSQEASRGLGGAKKRDDAFAAQRQGSDDHSREGGSPTKASRTEGVGGAGRGAAGGFGGAGRGVGGLEQSPSSSASLLEKRERGEESANSLAGEGSSKKSKKNEVTGGAGRGAGGVG
jgi:hypothetical protein